MKKAQLWFPVLAILLLIPKPGCSLSCIKCDGADCDKPDASKTIQCTDEKTCFTYGSPGSTIRGCAPETQVTCVKGVIGEKNCYSATDSPAETKAKVEDCLKGGPGEGTLGRDKRICYCGTDNCNSESSAFATVGGNITRLSGYRMPRIKCFDCTSEYNGVRNAYCEDGNSKKLFERGMTAYCEGICYKSVVPRTPEGEGDIPGFVKRTCVPMYTQAFQCWKTVMDMCWVASNDKKGDEDLANDFVQKVEDVRSCLMEHGIQADLHEELSTTVKGKPIIANCWCDSPLCNPADPLGPNRKLILAMAVAYLPVSITKLF